MLTNKNLRKIMLTGILAGTTLSGAAADKRAAANEAAGESASTGETMTVYSPEVEKEAGSKTTLTASDMQKEGGNDFGTIMRYQPLISATGAGGGANTGKSGYSGDRGGYTGYNIRGMESNRVAIEVDGIAQPNATGRSYAGRAGANTFGIGRDYIDPYLYGQVDIESGATSVAKANNALGGIVSFQPKSADDYLSRAKSSYFGYQSAYDSANRSWQNGITAAAGDETLRGLVVISRRDGQETANNSDTLDAYPANWHSNAVLASAIWQPNGEHRLTGTLDYYHKTNHTDFDYWGTGASTIYGRAQQTSQTRRWSASLKDRWTPVDNALADLVDTRLFYQQTEAHDNTAAPAAGTGFLAAPAHTIYSDYEVKTYGIDTQLLKNWGLHEFSGGFNASESRTERPYRQAPELTSFNNLSKPEADSRSYALGGFLQDKMTWNLSGHAFSVVPAARVAYQNTKPTNLSNMTGDGSVIDAADVETLYGSFSDTQVLPSLSFLYEITPRLTTYLQYKRGAQFPNASQLYGSYNLPSSWMGAGQYALIGNSDLDTETSNNVEWGLKGEMTEGVTFSTAVFYNTYKNFIDYTRYGRAANPEKFTNVPGNIYTIYQSENRDKAYIYGGEISARFNLGTWYEQVEGLSARLAFGYAKGQAKSRYAGDKYVDLDSVAPMKAIVGVAYDDPAQRYGAALTATFNKGKRATATNRQNYNNSGGTLTDATTEYMRVPGYGVVDLTAYYRVAKNVKVSGGVYNMTDRKYWDYLSSRNLESATNQDRYDRQLSIAPGRTFQLGINVDF